MGDIADYYIEQMLSEGHSSSRYVDRKKSTWATADGRELIPQEMSDMHILNCIHLCERRHDPEDPVIDLNEKDIYRDLVVELIRRDKLKYSYFDLSIEERLQVRFTDWSEFE